LNLISNRFYSYAVARGINGIMAFATVVVFTRLLGQEGYGEYALMMSFVGCFSAFFFQWIAVSCGRFLPGEKNPKIVYSSVKIMSSQSVVLVVFISFFLVFFWC
jgi:O-antigen/teichoic acid export membrane protein